MRLRPGCDPDPAEGADIAPPDSLAGFERAASRQREWDEKGERRKIKEWREENAPEKNSG